MLLAIMFSLAFSAFVSDTSFLERQLSFSRVEHALAKNNERIDKQCEATGTSKFSAIYLRAFKQEKLLEIWKLKDGAYVLYDTFPICHASGVLGPKRKQGDLQVPEGFYQVKVFNPASNYLLSLGIDYPNTRDEIVNKPPRGGDIYIHGGCSSIGCLAMEDLQIEEIYVLAMLARAAGQDVIPVHIFPFKMTEQNFKKYYQPIQSVIADFWKSIQPVYLFFESKKTIPKISVTPSGNYIIN